MISLFLGPPFAGNDPVQRQHVRWDASSEGAPLERDSAVAGGEALLLVLEVVQEDRVGPVHPGEDGVHRDVLAQAGAEGAAYVQYMD